MRLRDAAARGMSLLRRSVWELVKEEKDGANLAVPCDYEIGFGDSRRLARAALQPMDRPPIAHHLRGEERLISEVWMSSLYDARDAIDFLVAAVSATFWGHRTQRLRGRSRRSLRADTRGRSHRTRRGDCEATSSIRLETWFFSVGCRVRRAPSRSGEAPL